MFLEFRRLAKGASPRRCSIASRDVASRAVFAIDQCTPSRHRVHCRSIIESTRPTASTVGLALIANVGVGLAKALHLGHSTGSIREQQPCTKS
jgi:hypothetical protein